jgi:hypothetical protein
MNLVQTFVVSSVTADLSRHVLRVSAIFPKLAVKVRPFVFSGLAFEFRGLRLPNDKERERIRSIFPQSCKVHFGSTRRQLEQKELMAAAFGIFALSPEESAKLSPPKIDHIENVKGILSPVNGQRVELLKPRKKRARAHSGVDLSDRLKDQIFAIPPECEIDTEPADGLVPN